jgi:uncharacterized protein (TIGR03437 family)
MANGPVATLSFEIASNTGATSANIQVTNVSATTTSAGPLNASGSGGTITINQPVNQAPNAQNASTSTNEDTAKVIPLTASDPDGDSLTYSIVSGPSKGALSGSGASRTYTPNANATGADSFTFRVNDGRGGTDDGVISITINAVNDPPTAQNQSVTTAANTAKAIALVGSDIDGDSLAYSIFTAPAHGTVTGSGANRTYTPANNYSGPDSFVFRVSDGNANANGTVSITVTAAPNSPPTATDASTSTNEDTQKGITLTGTDPNGDSLTFTVLSQPSKGSLSGTPPNLTYTPNANATGADSFNFRASDGKGGTDDGTISITIIPVNDPPTTQNQSVSTAQNTAKGITLPGSDVDGDNMTFTVTSGPTNGSVTGGSGPSRTYTPNNGYSGPDAFSYIVTDGNGGSDNGTVSITVTPGANNPPTATDASTSTNEDTPKGITLTGTDSDGDSLTFTVMSQPSKGTLSGTPPNLTYTPTANVNGADSFTFRAADGKGGTDIGTINITINPVNDPPTAPNQSVSTAQNTPKAITLTGTDVDGDSLSYTITSAPTHGTLSGGTTGPNHTYTPANGYTGPDSFTFTVSDGKGGQTSGTVNINVTASQNGAPTATDASKTTNEGTPLQITLAGTDPNGDTLTFTVLSQPSKGSLSGTPPNLTYTPAANATGADSFSFRASDGKGGTDDGVISINITPANAAPTTQNQSVSTAKNTPLPIQLIASDVDGDTLAFSITGGPSHGSLSGGAGFVGPGRTYTPANNYTGPDSFTYKVDDGKGGTTTGTVAISVTDGPNQAPTATDASVSTTQGSSVNITLKGSDPNGDTLTFSIVSGPANGTLSGSAPNMTYTPNSGFSGSDSFTFMADDNNGGSDVGVVNINVEEAGADTVILSSVSCSGDGLTGGGARTCEVTIDRRAPAGGARVNLACQTKQLVVPDSVRIFPRARSARFKIYSPLIESKETVQLTASTGTAANATSGQVALGNSVSTQLTLVPLQPTDLSCSPVQVDSGDRITCRANLNSSSFSEAVKLAVSSSTSDVKVPDSLSIRAGQSSTSFRAYSSESSTQQSATVTVALNGGQASSTVSILTEAAPTIKVANPQVISAGKQLSFNVTAEDPNSLPVELSAADVPSGASFQANTGRFTWTPGQGQVGTHLVTFTARNSAKAEAKKVVTVDVILGEMKIYGFTNAASSWGGSPCSPGSLATVWGVGFTDGSSERARRFPLPTTLNEVRVEVNNRRASLLYVSDRQVNLQCPFLRSGEELSITLERRDTGESAIWSTPGVAMKEATPSIFSVDGSGTGQGLVIISSMAKLATLPTPDFDGQAAQPGDHLTIYANGLGLVDNPVEPGDAAASSPLSQVVSIVRVRVGDVVIPVTFAGLAPDLAGVYQVNTVLSDIVPTGPEVPVSLEIQLPDGTVLQSNTVTIAIQDGEPRFSE